ncbi:PAS domain S-box protein [Hufsiella ginkgonis]|uniref:histidine kinase n=1 Tax=Hufsiella ginkgonis TaxID=2695274 RepID=A0A7K1XX29_9SPHI|nr:PAS domain S-box protein [Hufsiella ginkgonis]MXV15368.1 PAS domain S-box protein [Hufsiella ginkgonis]
MNKLKTKWNDLIGSAKEFSMEARTYHAACIISIIVLTGFLLVNLLLHLLPVIVLSISVLILLLTFYCLSRFKKLFRFSVMGSAVISYLALISNYYFNSGINGPTIFLFFFTFNLLIIITPRRQHIVWIVLHVVVVMSLLFVESAMPDIFRNTYPNARWRTYDIFFTYLITLLFIYYVTIYIRNYYKSEKKLAQSRALELEKQMLIAENSEAKLRAFFHSSSICHVLLDKGMHILDFNNAVSEFIGKAHSREIVLGSNIMEYLSESYKERFLSRFRLAIEGITAYDDLWIDYGEFSIWWSFKYEPAWDTKGDILGISFNGANMNELKKHEIALREKNETLLKIAHFQSHELRAPVASILGLMSIIRESGYKDSEECLLLMEKAVRDLDQKIHHIVKQTE